ncbi:uncharacterized protein [Haliotis cracherodii]|uniref:uncharacterized protein n=1 Tax=Haliotis cracherodii TaxID=6455 RepID=UPI0039EA3B2D
MGVIRNTYEEESDTRNHVKELYNSDCIIPMDSVYDRLQPPPSPCGCGTRPTPTCDRESSPARSNSWPSGGGRRRARRSVVLYTPNHYTTCLHHGSVHWSTGQPELDTGQTEVELPEVKSKNENCGRVCCPKCGSRGHWNKSKMLRLTGQCILFLIIASCGGLIINNNFGGDEHAPGIVDIVETTQLKGVHLQPVPLSELKRQLQHTKNYYDFLRIFLNKKDLSNELIDEIVNARTIQKFLGAEKKSRDFNEEFDDEESWGVDEDDMHMDEEQDRLDEELSEAMYHIEEMANSPLGECKTPQPEIVNVIDEENKHRVYFPQCTVVHRCKNVSGCCGSTNRECGPIRIEVIEKSFIVVQLIGDNTLPDKNMVEKKNFINHTECACKEKQGLPNCDKYKCPFPFMMMRKGVQCTCDCEQSADENNYVCQSIKDGFIPLQERDLACIKAKTCLKPVCTHGTLHVQSGHCPSIQNDDIGSPFEASIERQTDRHVRHLRHKKGRNKDKKLRKGQEKAGK